MDDGTEVEGSPGAVAKVLPGHNTWVVGDEVTCLLHPHSSQLPSYGFRK